MEYGGEKKKKYVAKIFEGLGVLKPNLWPMVTDTIRESRDFKVHCEHKNSIS